MTGVGPTPTLGGGMYFAAFAVDRLLLNANYAVHFDLYHEVVHLGGDIDVDHFAPFSHDAQSSVPEPGTVSVWVMAVTLAVVQR